MLWLAAACHGQQLDPHYTPCPGTRYLPDPVLNFPGPCVDQPEVVELHRAYQQYLTDVYALANWMICREAWWPYHGGMYLERELDNIYAQVARIEMVIQDVWCTQVSIYTYGDGNEQRCPCLVERWQ